MNQTILICCTNSILPNEILQIINFGAKDKIYIPVNEKIINVSLKLLNDCNITSNTKTNRFFPIDIQKLNNVLIKLFNLEYMKMMYEVYYLGYLEYNIFRDSEHKKNNLIRSLEDLPESQISEDKKNDFVRLCKKYPEFPNNFSYLLQTICGKRVDLFFHAERKYKRFGYFKSDEIWFDDLVDKIYKVSKFQGWRLNYPFKASNIDFEIHIPLMKYYKLYILNSYFFGISMDNLS